MSATDSSHWAKDSLEEDRVEALIRSSGCWDQHISVVDCMGSEKDWRLCQIQLSAFKECMSKCRAKVQKKTKE
uniref:Cytochrome c oxidase assembly factor 4 homolog, mitochondrial n=1 Tax=Heterorhabditis bacteriophora TaxID=37862 RepID=A0A1I7X1S8_HETBA